MAVFRYTTVTNYVMDLDSRADKPIQLVAEDEFTLIPRTIDQRDRAGHFLKQGPNRSDADAGGNEDRMVRESVGRNR
jgi:hypothetical protein